MWLFKCSLENRKRNEKIEFLQKKNIYLYQLVKPVKIVANEGKIHIFSNWYSLKHWSIEIQAVIGGFRSETPKLFTQARISFSPKFGICKLPILNSQPLQLLLSYLAIYNHSNCSLLFLHCPPPSPPPIEWLPSKPVPRTLFSKQDSWIVNPKFLRNFGFEFHCDPFRNIWGKSGSICDLRNPTFILPLLSPDKWGLSVKSEALESYCPESYSSTKFWRSRDDSHGQT